MWDKISYEKRNDFIWHIILKWKEEHNFLPGILSGCLMLFSALGESRCWHKNPVMCKDIHNGKEWWGKILL